MGLHPGGSAWRGSASKGILQDTVNERAVRILLECILVLEERLSESESNFASSPCVYIMPGKY